MQHYIRFALVLVLALLVASGACAGNKGGKGTEVRVAHPAPPPAVPAAGTVLYSEGFEGTTFPPAGWIIINRDLEPTPDNAWYQSGNIGTTAAPVSPKEGSFFAADYYGSANGFYIDDYLVSPNSGPAAPAGAVDSLVFWLASRLSDSGSYPDSLEVRVSTTGIDTANFTIRLAYVEAPKAVWQRFAYVLPQATNRYIAFRYLIYDGGSDGANSDKIGLDAVEVIRYTATSVGNPQQPVAFALQQNYPNPFNPSTQIQFSLAKGGFTTLRVYDALGRIVSTLVESQLPAGAHARTFDAAGLAGGVYFYRLNAGSFTQTHQMLLVK